MTSLTLAQLTTPRTKEEWRDRHVQTLQGVGHVKHVGSGAGSVLAYGVGAGDFAVVVEIVATGIAGVGQYRFSLDGGTTWSSTATVPPEAILLGSTGAALLFSDAPDGAGDSFVDGDTYSFRVWAPTLDATSWLEGSTPLTLLELNAEGDQERDELVAAIAKGGNLDDAEGAWADLHAKSQYREERSRAVSTKGEFLLTDAGGSGPHTIQARQLRVRNSAGLRFINETAGVLTALGTLKLTMVGEKPGRAYNIGANASLALETSLPGVTVQNPPYIGPVSKSRESSPDVSVAGASNGAYALAIAITTGGVRGAAVFKYSLDGGETWALAGITVPSNGAYTLGGSGLTATFAAGTYQVGDQFECSASLSWITRSGADRESDEQLRVRCRNKWPTMGVGAPGAAFDFWAKAASPSVTRTLVRASTTIPGRTEVFLAGQDGAVGADVVDAVDAALQPRAPLTSTILTQSATPLVVALVGTVYVRAGKLAATKAAAETDLAEYVGMLGIGGDSGLVSREVLIGCITGAGGHHDVVDLALATPASDPSVAATEVVTLDLTALAWVEV